MATPKFNSKSPTIRRILREAQEISSSPSADYTATPLENDLFEWHFTLRGPPNSAFAGGIYHGRIVLPPMYPLRPPSFRFVTPSGRFETNREICLSISGHHEETWQPAWGVRTALVALRSFMETDPKGQLGGLETSDDVRRRLASESPGFRCSVCAKTNGEIMDECEKAAQEHEAANGGTSSKEAAEVEVPSELKLAWRDELEASTPKPEAGTSGATVPAPPSTSQQPPQPPSQSAPQPQPPVQQISIHHPQQQPQEDSESDELAEGFVPTDPLDSISRYQEVRIPRRRAAAGIPRPAAQPGQRVVPQPTGAGSSANPFAIPPSNVHPQQIPRILIQRQQQRLLREQRAAAASNREEMINVWIDRLILGLGVLLALLVLKVLFW